MKTSSPVLDEGPVLSYAEYFTFTNDYPFAMFNKVDQNENK